MKACPYCGMSGLLTIDSKNGLVTVCVECRNCKARTEPINLGTEQAVKAAADAPGNFGDAQAIQAMEDWENGNIKKHS